jgi:hypothetical protein
LGQRKIGKGERERRDEDRERERKREIILNFGDTMVNRL